MEQKRIEEIRERERETSPGPWFAMKKGNNSFGYVSTPMIYGFDSLPMEIAWFIANARQDIPFLLSEYDRLTAKVEKLEAETELYKESFWKLYKGRTGQADKRNEEE